MLVVALLIFALLANKVESIYIEAECTIKKFEEVNQIVNNCQNVVLDGISVPGGKELTLKLNDGATLAIRGTTTFEYYEWKGPLFRITGSNITVIGEKDSVLDGQGHLYWDGKGTWGNTTKPKFARVTATNSILEGINIKNCPVGCISVSSSENVTIRNWKIDVLNGDERVAPENKFGHNTDGFDVGTCTNLLLEDIFVYNQDDCVAVNSGKNLTFRNMFCHGSHGLSISARAATIEDVLFENSIVVGGENGIHVKTHVDSGNGLIKNVLYTNITLLDSTNYGINIQQNYRNLPAGEHQDGPPSNNIPIYNLTLKNIFGNALSGAVPVCILCAEEGCFDWEWENINIYGAAKNNCTNYIPKGFSC